MRLTHAFAALALSLGTFPTAAATTGPTGNNVEFSTYQPSLALQQFYFQQGIYPSRSSDGLEDFAYYYTLGMVRTSAGFARAGSAFADGRTLPISGNEAMFSIIGSQYGGNGTSNFAIPDLGGTTIVGALSGGQGAVDGYAVASKLGTSTTILTEAQLPAHNHSLPGGGTTGITGSGNPVDIRQPSLSLTYLIAAGGIYPGNGAAVSIGQVVAFAGDFVPRGLRPADGSTLAIDDFSALYSIIGTTYGGDGLTTFKLPDLRGRTVVGAGAGPGLTPITLGQTFGSDFETISLDQLPEHDHSLPGGGVTGATGGATPLELVQASIGLNYLVTISGLFPLSDSGYDPESPYLGEIIAFAGNYAPRGYAFADGSLLNINSNLSLFSLFGTTYGGDGRVTFGLPDLRGRTIIGTNGGLALGTQIGAESIQLDINFLASHTHDLADIGVPEPASWALLIAGFGLTGAAMRRRRRIAV